MWQLELDAMVWHEARLSGPAPGSVLAAVFRSQDRAFYVLDGLKVGPLALARLWRISLDTLRSSVVGSCPRLRRFDRTYLSVAEDGDLLLAVTGGARPRGGSWLAKLEVGAGAVGLRWLRHERGRLIATPVLSHRGLTAWYEQGGAKFVGADELRPRGPSLGDLGDCF